MLLPCISQPMLEMMPQKERIQEGHLFFLISILSYSSVSQKQRALVEYRISRSERETVELMFCSFLCFGKKELCMYKLQNTIFKNNFDYSASMLNALTFAFQQELHNIKRNDKIHGKFLKFCFFTSLKSKLETS